MAAKAFFLPEYQEHQRLTSLSLAADLLEQTLARLL